MSYEVVLADIDSTGDRGRVKTRVKVKILVDEKIREKEVMLYFHRQDAASPWLHGTRGQPASPDGRRGQGPLTVRVSVQPPGPTRCGPSG